MSGEPHSPAVIAEPGPAIPIAWRGRADALVDGRMRLDMRMRLGLGRIAASAAIRFRRYFASAKISGRYSKCIVS